MKVIDCVQGTPEWLAARAGIATASCFAAARAKSDGATRRNYLAQLVVERLTGRCMEKFQSAAMKQGTEREPAARSIFESRNGVWVAEVGFCRHDEIEAGASPDGLIDEHGGVEIKCPELAAHLEYLDLPAGQPPAKYLAQIQGSMWITGRDWWTFVSYNPDFPEKLQLVQRDVLRDDAYIAKLADDIAGFMEEVKREEKRLRERLA